jgi:hypothetical protein
MLNRIEDYAIARWGFENRKTIFIFRLTSLLRNDKTWGAICIWFSVGLLATCFAILASK